SKKEGIIDAWVFRIFVPPVQLSGEKGKAPIESVQSLIHWQIDCSHRTHRRVSSDAYDAQGHWLLATTVPEHPEPFAPIEQNSTQDFLARVTCDGAMPPGAVIVTGHAAALALGRRALGATPS
ncbi:MAG TPA: surface-adhesin E family protein, partial [Phenylobacterium sp.]|nr:surface-adhesin E family protein [Phenylobacterium sp.]